MDSQILQHARDLLVWAGPLVAGGTLAKIGENTTDRTTQLLARLWSSVRTWLAADEDAASDLRKLEKQPENASRQQIVAETLAQAAATNSTIAAELATLHRELQSLHGGAGSRTHNQTVGGNARVGTAVAGDVHGGITVGRMDFGDHTTSSAPTTPQSRGSANTAAPANRTPLPATLSADGVHFTYGHALLIGVGQYANWYLSAPGTAKDAEQLATLLKDPQVAAYPADQVRVVSDSAATQQGILDALDAFAQELAAAPQSTALVFFAGHGIQRDDGYYLLPYDYTSSNLAATAISAAQFHAKVDAIRRHAQKLVVLLNCCHAGGVGDDVLSDGDAGATTDAPPPAFYQPLVEGSGQVVISSSKPAQKSGAKSSVDPQLTTFGAQLVAALKGQAPGQGAGVGVFDLFAYLSTQVPQDARSIQYQGKPLDQHPLLYAHQVDQNFALALRPGRQDGADDTMSGDVADVVQELARIEIQLAAFQSEAEAPAELVQRRDDLLLQLGAG